MHYRWMVLRHWFTNTLPWDIAWALPRKVALMAFVRVYVAASDGNGPHDEYVRVYKSWEAGKGK